MTKRLGIGLALGLLSAQASWVLAQDQNLRDPLYELYISSTTPEHYKRIIETMLLNPDSDQSGTTSLGPAVLNSLGTPPPARLRLLKIQGGLVRRADRAAVVVPSFALAQDLEISITHPTAQPARETAAAGNGLRQASLPVTFGPEGTVFNAPVTVILPYDASLLQAQGLRETDLKVHYWNTKTNAWEELASHVDAAAHTVSADVLHFSVYQVLGPGGGAIATAAATEPSFGLKNIFTYPNPARAGAEPIFHVEVGIADRVNIRVYDAAGREVHNVTLEQAPRIKDMGSGPQYVYEHIWDGPIASGVYFYVVEAEKANEPKISKGGRMAVVR